MITYMAIQDKDMINIEHLCLTYVFVKHNNTPLQYFRKNSGRC